MASCISLEENSCLPNIDSRFGYLCQSGSCEVFANLESLEIIA